MAKTFTARLASQLTDDMIDDLTGPELVAAFNAMAEMAKVKSVNKFADRPTAEKRLRQLRQQTGTIFLEIDMAEAAVPKGTKIKKPGTPRPPKNGKPVSVSGRCQELIRAGMSNSQIWAIIQPEFGLADAKKTYPAWNRSMLRRAGEEV